MIFMRCSFCSKEIEQGTGTMFVKNDGRISYYCSSKCDSNAQLRRNPAETNWVRKKQVGAAKTTTPVKK